MSAPGSPTRVDWLAGLSPWPSDGFGVERMLVVLGELGDPQGRFDAIHVVGTNGKSTATRTIEALLLAEGLSVGATVSPHVRSWAERITIDGDEVDLEAALGRVEEVARRHGATQFETITAAAFASFAAAGIDVAVVEAGLGGRHDATNVLRARVVLLTSVGLEHTEVLGDTLEAIAAEKLAVAPPRSVVVLPELRFAHLVAEGCDVRLGGAREAAAAWLGRAPGATPEVSLPGRLERRPTEVRDGAHNPDGVRWLVEQLHPGSYVICASILEDKDVDAMLGELASLGETFVATRSSNPRALAADVLVGLARSHFSHVESVTEPLAAVERAHALGSPVLVTGSLYLLMDLAKADDE